MNQYVLTSYCWVFSTFNIPPDFKVTRCLRPRCEPVHADQLLLDVLHLQYSAGLQGKGVSTAGFIGNKTLWQTDRLANKVIYRGVSLLKNKGLLTPLMKKKLYPLIARYVFASDHEYYVWQKSYCVCLALKAHKWKKNLQLNPIMHVFSLCLKEAAKKVPARSLKGGRGCKDWVIKEKEHFFTLFYLIHNR